MKTLRLLLSALACTTASLASAAPLDVTSDTLIKQTDMFRDAHDLPWAPATGRLGNLRQVRIVADNCTVRMVSGPENRFYWGRARSAWWRKPPAWRQRMKHAPGPVTW